MIKNKQITVFPNPNTDQWDLLLDTFDEEGDILHTDDDRINTLISGLDCEAALQLAHQIAALLHVSVYVEDRRGQQTPSETPDARKTIG